MWWRDGSSSGVLLRLDGTRAVEPVAGVADLIAIAVGLIRVGRPHAVVAGVAHPVLVVIFLVGVLDPGAVVNVVEDAVIVGVLVAGVAHAVAIAVDLGGVEDPHAVVDLVWHAVVVDVARGQKDREEQKPVAHCYFLSGEPTSRPGIHVRAG